PQAIQRQLNFLQQQQPGNPYVQVLYGDLAMQLEDYTQAKNYYGMAIQSERQPASAYFGLGYLYETQSQLEQALLHYRQAVERSTWNQSYLNNLATVFRKLGHYQEAIEHYEKILKLDLNYLLAHLGIAQSYAHSGKPKMAMRYLQQMLALMEQAPVSDHPKNKAAWSFHGVLLETPDEKRQYALYHLGLAFFLLDQEDTARNYLQEARAIKTAITAKIKAVVAQDIELLVKKNTQYETQAKKFRQQYLK
ncbi:MAG: tetratricopeptide repeat protein, partial [Nitrosomonas sp.]|nr:tetratricopeptide repeat protein [Nitrosomonas sp.]